MPDASNPLASSFGHGATSLLRPSRGDGLLTKTALFALLLWLLNDHVLKRLTPGVLTGKLSDVASLIVLPLALQAAWELGLKREPFTPSRASIVTAIALVAAFFVWMEGTALGSLAFRSVLAVGQWPLALLHARAWSAPRLVTHTADLEDLLTLPSLLLPYRVGMQRVRLACEQTLRASVAGLALALLFALASPSMGGAQALAPADAARARADAASASSVASVCAAESGLPEAQRHASLIEVRREELRYRARESPLFFPIAGVVLGFGGALMLVDSSRDMRATQLGVGLPLLGVGVASAVWLGTRVRERRAIRAGLRLLAPDRELARQHLQNAQGAFANCQSRQHTPSERSPEAFGTVPLPPASQPNAFAIGVPPLETPAARQFQLGPDLAAQATEARRAQYPLAPPIALIAAGYATSLVSAAVATWIWWYDAPSFELDEPATPSQKRLMRGFGGAAIAGAVAGAAGVGWLVRRLQLRRAPAPEYGTGSQRSRALSPAFAPAFSSSSLSLSLSFAL